MMKDKLKLMLPVLLLVLTFISAADAQSSGLSIGQAAPDFALKDVQGKTHALKDYRGKTVIVGFFSTRCPIVNAYHERIRALTRDYSGRDVVLLGVYPNSNEPLSAIKARAAEQKFTFPVLKDEGSATADLYHAQSTPEMFVIDRAGTLRYHGRIDNSPELPRVKRHDLRAALDELLAGQPVSVTETRAFGCQIKRGKAVAPVKAAAPVNSAQVVSLLKPADFARLREQLRGQVLVVNFWATWCGPCVAEFPEFVRIDEKYRARGVKVISISADETAELQSKVVPFIKKQNAKFDVYVQDVDEPEDMIKQFSREWSGALPATFVFDKQGRLTQSFLGIIDREKLEAALEAALKP
ncbi:MAG: redoxin domain-containing protein [Blastocatellia bacterium]